MKTKSAIAGVMAAALALSAVGIGQVSAASSVTLRAEDTTATVGGSFSVNVYLEDLPDAGVNVLDFAVAYDSAVLTVTDVSVGEAAAVDGSADTTTTELPLFNAEIQDGAVNVNWSTGLGSACTISTEGVILTISGTVSSTAAAGTETPIEFAPINRPLYDGSTEMNEEICIGFVDGTTYEQYEVSEVAGSVTITGSGAETTTEAPTTTAAPETTTETVPTTTAEPVVSSETPTSQTTGGGTTNLLYGDTNCDGRIDITDAVHLNRALADVVTLNEGGRANADVNADGRLSADDASVLLRFLVSLIDSLPYTQ